MTLYQYQMPSPLGPLYLVATTEALTGVYWRPQTAALLEDLDLQEASILRAAQTQLAEYFLGKRKLFDLPLSPRGTDFQMRVWSELAKIPYGETATYKDIAIRIQNEKGVRAVGLANGRNPISIFIPCHRVIGSSGKLTGYAGGLENKTFLIGLEKGSAL